MSSYEKLNEPANATVRQQVAGKNAKQLQDNRSKTLARHVNDAKGMKKEADVMGGTIQRKIGFEFQVSSNLSIWENKNGKKEVKTTGKIYDGKGFHIESDDGDVEVVTDAFVEDDNETKMLLTAVGTGQSMVEGLENKKKVSLPEFTGSKGENKDDISIGPENDTKAISKSDLKAKPQITTGIALDSLMDLFHSYGIPVAGSKEENPDINGNDINKAAIYQKYGRNAEYRKLAEKAASGHPEDKEKARKWLAENKEEVNSFYMQMTKNYFRPSNTDKNSINSKDKIRNFVKLVELYLREATQQFRVTATDLQDIGTGKHAAYKVGDIAPSKYPKSHHSAMARTDFYGMYHNLLTKEEQAEVKKSLYRLAADLYKGEILYPAGYYDDATIKLDEYYTQEAQGKIRKGPKISDWLESMVGKENEESKYDEKHVDLISALPGEAQGKGTGAMRKKFDIVPVSDSKEGEIRMEKAGIFELRDMPEIEIGTWVTWSDRQIKFSKLLNAQRDSVKLNEHQLQQAKK